MQIIGFWKCKLRFLEKHANLQWLSRIVLMIGCNMLKMLQISVNDLIVFLW